MIKIFDTTLRDGEQAPGFSMNTASKIALAKQLENLGVDIIEAGFPIASPDDAEAVHQIGIECRNLEVCGLARCNQKDIEVAIRALESASKPRVHVFIATSDIHMEYKLKMTPDQVIKRAVMGVNLAGLFTDNVEFSPEDASRSDWKFLVEVLKAAVEAGATTLNIPDTVGYMMPEEYGKLIRFLKKNVKASENVVYSTHCHNDLGLAVANSLAGVRNGAGQIECTINGIGERAGNAALEEIIMAIKTRPAFFSEDTNIKSEKILSTSKMLSVVTGRQVQANKAIVGENAFAHEAGIHQHGMLSHRLTYEIMKPEDVGFRETNLVLGKHSGRAALRNRIQKLGYELNDERLAEIFEKFKNLADKKREIFDEDIIFLVTDEVAESQYELLEAKIISEKDNVAIAYAKIRVADEEINETASGDGPVDALHTCIGKVVDLPGKMTHFNVSSLTPHRDAIGVVTIQRTQDDGEMWQGQGSDTDTTIAAGKALINLLNRKAWGQTTIVTNSR